MGGKEWVDFLSKSAECVGSNINIAFKFTDSCFLQVYGSQKSAYTFSTNKMPYLLEYYQITEHTKDDDVFMWIKKFAHKIVHYFANSFLSTNMTIDKNDIHFFTILDRSSSIDEFKIQIDLNCHDNDNNESAVL